MQHISPAEARPILARFAAALLPMLAAPENPLAQDDAVKAMLTGLQLVEQAESLRAREGERQRLA